ncbi:MAG: CUAEP/CCAEP-tail radical SAM protein [Actinomycetota bacterium]|nr:CUAEP/CCAEP-tail radical SAM protein [Actinomycetota bacterium]
MGKVVLISTYELGRQPFGLASPAAWLAEAGADVAVQDLAVSAFEPAPVRDALLVGIYVPMHAATRMAESVLTRVREHNAHVHVCVYGLYAPMNADHLIRLGADSVIGGEFEAPLTRLYHELAAGPGQDGGRPAAAPVISLDRQQFLVPDRIGLPELMRYAALQVGPGTFRTAGYTEASRGCKHLCRHCPVVPVYGGRFRVVQAGTVLNDIRQQVASGAQHITFGDPDFLNAPAHSLRIITQLHAEFPQLSYDVTVKVEHLCRHAALLPVLKRTGCALVTTAAEALDDGILERLDKGHTVADLDHALRLLRDNGLAVNPTFIAFTPWTTLHGYAEFLRAIVRSGLVDLISPVQYGIRLLIPRGSRILELDDVAAMAGGFDPNALAYPWPNPDPQVDDLCRDVLDQVKAGQRAGRNRRETFLQVWQATAARLEPGAPPAPDLTTLPAADGTVPQLTEPWYCCAEPTDDQLAGYERRETTGKIVYVTVTSGHTASGAWLPDLASAICWAGDYRPVVFPVFCLLVRCLPGCLTVLAPE